MKLFVLKLMLAKKNMYKIKALYEKNFLHIDKYFKNHRAYAVEVNENVFI
jgi:hypothetical protein